MATTTTFTKTGGTSLITLQSVGASAVAVGSAVSMATALGGLVYVRFGRRSATAAGAGCNIRIAASYATSGDNTWFPFARFTTNFAACEAEAVSGTVASGTNVVTVASTTNLVAGDIVFIDNTTIGNSEWGRVKSISSNVSITLEDNLVNAQTGATVYDAAEIFNAVEIPPGVLRLRATDDGSLFTQAHAIQVLYSLIDNMSAV